MQRRHTLSELIQLNKSMQQAAGMFPYRNEIHSPQFSSSNTLSVKESRIANFPNRAHHQTVHEQCEEHYNQWLLEKSVQARIHQSFCISEDCVNRYPSPSHTDPVHLSEKHQGYYREQHLRYIYLNLSGNACTGQIFLHAKITRIVFLELSVCTTVVP